MLCFLCCFSRRPSCFCHRGRQLRVSSTSDMTIVDVAGNRKMDSYRKQLRIPRRAHSEPPSRSEKLFFGVVRYCSLRDKKNDKKIIAPRFRVSVVSIPSSYELCRSVRKQRRQWIQEKKELEKSVSSSSSFSIPSEPRLRADMNDSGEEIPPEPHNQISIDYDEEIDGNKSPSRQAVLVNGRSRTTSSSSPFEIQKNFEIERLQLSTPPVDTHPPALPDNWNLKDSYKKDLEQYINSKTIANPWADPFEEDRRSRTEKWIESTTPGRQDSVETTEQIPPIATIAYDPLPESEESAPEKEETTEPVDNSQIQAEVEIIWKEQAAKEEQVLQDVVIKLNGEPVTAKRKHQVPHIETQDSLELPPSEVSFVSSTIEKESLVKQNYRSNLKSALEHSGDTISLDEVERFWNYQYNTTDDQDEVNEKRRRKELERMRGHTPTMERVVMFYTSDKRPSLITISPSPTPSGRSNSSVSEAYRLFDRKSVTPSPRPKLSRQSFESEDLYMSMEKDNLAEEITIEVPQLALTPNTNSSFFHLDQISSDEDDAGGKVELPNGKASPVRLYLSPHPRLRISRGTSTEDLQPGSSEGRSQVLTRPAKQYQSRPTQTMDTSHLQMESLTIDGNSISDVDSTSIDELLTVDFRAGSSSPSKFVHFAQKIDADIESLPKHQRDPLFRSPKSILKRMDSKATELKRVMEVAADTIYKDLRMLVEERDRCLHALEMLPHDTTNLSFDTAHYQTSYRDKLLENKGVLDAKIDHFWNKLRDLPLSEAQGAFVYGVEESKALTLNVKRKVVPARYIALQNANVATRRSKTNLEMASDYARKLADMRKAMIRRDSDIVQDDEKSVEEILKRDYQLVQKEISTILFQPFSDEADFNSHAANQL